MRAFVPILSLMFIAANGQISDQHYADLMAHDEIYAQMGRQAMNDRSAFVGNQMKKQWGATVPYFVDKTGMTEENVIVIEEAIDQMNKQWGSCVKLIPRTKEDDYVHVESKANGCWAYMGRIGGKQLLNLGKGCFEVDTVQHEFLHAIGFDHTHIRSDRDQWVTVDWSKVLPSKVKDLKTLSPGNNFGLPYDSKSVMQYAARNYCKPEFGGSCMKLKSTGEDLGRNNKLSAGDIAMVKKAYCKSSATNPAKPPVNNGKGDPNTTGGQSTSPECIDNLDYIMECPGKCEKKQELSKKLDDGAVRYYSIWDPSNVPEADKAFYAAYKALIEEDQQLTEFTSKNCRQSCNQCPSDF